MNDDQNYFFYPENLSEKALFFGWTGINLVIIAVGLVLSTINHCLKSYRDISTICF